MTRQHHYLFGHVALRDAFFDNPNGVLAALTEKGDRPLTELWHSVGAQLAEQGFEKLPSTGLSVTLVTFDAKRACAVVSLPQPLESLEAYFVALVSTTAGFRYVTLEKPDQDHEDGVFALLCEWTRDGAHINPRVPVPVALSDFLREVRNYVG